MAKARNNPVLAAFANPKRKNDVMSRHVLAIVYVHNDDGKLYVHGFGGRDPKIIDRPDGVTLKGIARRSDVLALAEDDGSVHLAHADGLPIWGEY